MVTRTDSIALILIHTFLFMLLLVHAFAEGGSDSDQQLSHILRVEQKTDDVFIQNDNDPEAEQPSGNVDQPRLTTEGEEDEGIEAEAPANRRLGKHKGTDPSVAGGGVILGGLAMAVFVTVFSYIRVTRKRTNNVNV